MSQLSYRVQSLKALRVTNIVFGGQGHILRDSDSELYGQHEGAFLS